MLSTKLSGVDEALVRAVCTDQWPESETLEFKQILPRAGDNDAKLEFVKDVSAIANSGGGDLVYGISEKGGAAHTPIPLAEPVDSAMRRLEQVLEAGVEPRIQGIQFHPVMFAAGGYVLVLRIPASFVGPHRCISERRFVARTNSRTSDMSYDQLRTAFDRTATLMDRARQFRSDRVGELIDRSTWKSKTSGPLCALHLIPLSALSGRSPVDLEKLLRDTSYLGLQAWQAGGWNWSYNLDGLAAHTSTGDGTPLAGATQFYRNGQMEAGFAFGAHSRRMADKLSLPSIWLSEFYREAATRFLKLSSDLGISGPAIIAATLVHVDEYEFSIGQLYNMLNRSFVDREHLVLPEIWIDDLSQPIDPDAVVRPMLDVLWQCFGAPRCLAYGEDGVWKPGLIR